MTVSTGPLADLLLPPLTGQPAPSQPLPVQATTAEDNTYRWAAVTQLSPLRVQLDGENIPLPITPESLVESAALRIGTRVWTQLFGRRVIILGASGGGSAIEVPIGGMVPWAGATAPNDNWLLAQGGSYLRADHPELFAVIGTTYGAVDGTHFNVPDTRDRFLVGSGGAYTRGSTGGAATVTLDSTMIPGHTHSFSGNLTGASTGNESSHTHGAGSYSASSVSDHQHSVNAAASGAIGVVANGATGYAQVNPTNTGSAGGHGHSVTGASDSGSAHNHSVTGGTVSGTSGSTGGGAAHQNMPPYLAVPCIIRAH